MAKKVNLQGARFERLTVLSFIPPPDRSYFLNTWLCSCDCGSIIEASTSHLKNGNVKSCGCLKNETFVNNKLSSGLTYSSWHAMIVRCAGSDENYVEKGRKVCERWLEPNSKGFLNFLEDMGERPQGLTLERKDNSLDYFPENCKWDTVGNQCYNRDIFKNSTSGRTGIHQRKDNGSWKCYINVGGKRINLGTFDNFEDALKARETAELEYYGFIKES